MQRGLAQRQCRAGSMAGCQRTMAVQRLASGASAVRSRVVVRAGDMDAVDPITGNVITSSSAKNPIAGNKLVAGGHEWAYRMNSPDAAKASADKPDAILLHGLGSSSWCYRNTLDLLGAEGFRCVAPDWLGHGDSAKPSTSAFDYSQESYIKALDDFVNALDVKKPVALIVHGFVLGQYALLWAARHPDKVSRLLLLNTPISLGAKLRPELAAYKTPIAFLRPGNKPFDGTTYAAQGSPYAMSLAEAQNFGRPYAESPAASAALAATMDRLDFGKLLKEVDEEYRTWRKPSVLLFGAADPFIELKSVFEFLDTKRTNMKAVTASAKLGHMPQEDYPEAIHETLVAFLSGSSDKWDGGQMMKMTKTGATRA